MSSRRLMSRSLSSDGRTNYSGTDINFQSSRVGCRSYLSNIRPESSYVGQRFSQFKPSRSTLCSVMAQLTEETQPTFESTLKSKAVSEASNAKFSCVVSGYPTPDVIWYKDDVQLDRYCGLPKYEILHDGKAHTLHIYNCSLEDAAIYQASAQNSRGIVSCSGVLEVGTMNEYKIHQNYFARLKQRNESRRLEQEEPCITAKETVPAAYEHIRISSPERAQRKRRSPIESGLTLGAASSTEERDDMVAVCHLTGVEDRLGNPAQESPLNGISKTESILNGDKTSQGLTYIHDTVHKVSGKQTTKEHYAKKKIKISTGVTETSKETRKTERGEVKSVKEHERGPAFKKLPSTPASNQQNNANHVASEIEFKKNVDITDDTKPSVKVKESASQLKKTQITHKLPVTQKRPVLKVSMATQTVVNEDTEQNQSKTSNKEKKDDRGPPLVTTHPQQQAPDAKQHVPDQKGEYCNPTPVDKELMDLVNHENEPPVGKCEDILAQPYGGIDVNENRGERNVSAQSPRGMEVVMELNQQPPLISEVTSCVMETHSVLSSCHTASQEQKNRPGDHSLGSTNNSTRPVTGHDQSGLQSTQPGEKIILGHISGMLQEEHVTTVLNSSLEKDPLSDMSETDHEDGNQMMKEDLTDDGPIVKTQPVAISLNSLEENEIKISANKNKESTSANTQVGEKIISKENPTENLNHSIHKVIVTEFVQAHNLTRMSNSNVVQPQIKTLVNSSISDVPKDIKSHHEMEQGPTNLTPSQRPKAKYYERKIHTKKENEECVSPSLNTTIKIAVGEFDNGLKADPPTFLSQDPKALPTEFTIPAIFITDVDSTPQNSENTEITVSINPKNARESVPFCTGKNTVTSHVSNSNNGSQTGNTLNHPDTMNEIITAVSEDLVDLSKYSILCEVNQPDQQSLNQDKARKNTIEGPESQSGTDNVADFVESSSEATMLLCKENSTRTKSGLAETKCLTLVKPEMNSKPEQVSFIKQLKCAALDLEKLNQSPTGTKLSPEPHGDSKDKDREVHGKGESVVPQTNGSLKTLVSPLCASSEANILLKTANNQVLNSAATNSELATRAQQTTIISNTKTEKGELGMVVCLEDAQKDTYQGDKISLKIQPVPPLQSVNYSPFKTSLENHSPCLTRKAVTDSKPAKNGNDETISAKKDKENQFKAPQVIRKIRPEVFDASGHLKLWCQFFNILSDSTIRWYKDEVEIAEIKRSAGDETQVCLAIVQTSKRDCGLYKCTITNEYGKDYTEYILSAEVFSNMFLREELHEVGEEIEMTPLIFSKGLAEAGCWGSKFYGRLTTEEAQVGTGCEHKTRRLKVIYGLEPVFESGSSCFMKVRSPIAYESREESILAERNLQITKQDCKIQNMAREYFKIFAAEIREIESFGPTLEVIPLYFMYRPASSVPYATVEVELKGVYLRYCGLDHTGSLVFNNKSEVAQKCSSLQHWIHQWTNGNVLFTRLEGVDTILTNIGIATKSKGYQGFPCEANPKVFEQFQTQHQCNYFCGLLKLKSLQAPDTLHTPARSRSSNSPLLQRRSASGSSSPQTQRKTTKSPKVSRKANPQTST